MSLFSTKLVLEQGGALAVRITTIVLLAAHLRPFLVLLLLGILVATTAIAMIVLSHKAHQALMT